MLDELKEEAIVNKVGGRFKLSTLIQKRCRAQHRGPAAGRHAQRRQDGDRDPGDLAGQDLPGRFRPGAVARHVARDAARRAMLGDISSDLGGGDD